MNRAYHACVIVSVLSSVGLVAYAAEHRIPSAPADYLEKKNPLEGQPEAIAKGAKVYAKRCERCHGIKGDGLGKSAKDLDPAVTAFTGGYLKQRKDGQLFWIIEKGSPNTDMEAFGPGTNFNHTHDELWSVIAYLRSKFGK